MANIKISALPNAAALTGTEQVPLVQGGATVKTTAQDIANLGGGGGGGVMVAGSGTCSIVGSGCNNLACGAFSFVGGGAGNTASGFYSAAIVGGGINSASGNYAIVGGGFSNTASGDYSVVVGGCANTASAYNSFVGSGRSNTACGACSFIGNGDSNTASGSYSFVGGGSGNTACGCNSFIGGGLSNTAQCNYTGVFGCNVTNTTPCSFMSNQLIACNIFGAGAICADASGVIVPVVSDKRLKTNICSLACGIDRVSLLNPVTYTWIDEKYGKGGQIGFIAQEVEKVVPEAVFKTTDDDYGFNDRPLVALLTKTVQEQEVRIAKLEKLVQELMGK